MKKFVFFLLPLLMPVFSAAAFGQTVSSKPNNQSSAKPPLSEKNTCAEEVKNAQNEAYTNAFKLSADFYETKIPVGKDQKLKIEILVEEAIENTEAFRFAAAEVIRTQFGEKFEIDPEAKLALYISGTKPLSIGNKNVQQISVAVVAFIPHTFNPGGKSHTLAGQFEFTNAAGGLLSGYSAEQKTQEIREDTYSVLSKFLEKWAAN